MNYREFIADPARDCSIVAHRGFWRDAPENSLLAIERVIDAGYEVVEIDIRRSADGGLFLLHDETLERMAGLDAAPENLSSQQLSALALRNRDGGAENAFTGEKLPSLADVFELTRGRIFLHLDVKDRDVIPDVIACAKAMGVESQIDLWASLKTEKDLAWIRETIIPHDVLFMAKTRLNVPSAAAQIALLSELSPSVCEIYFDRLEELAALDGALRENGMALWVNTLDSIACAGFTDTAALVDPDAVWGRLINAGISVIQTDEAAALQSYLAARRA
ncbi:MULTISPECIES: glycerophosphodiester phosphodiesterase family protein [unclassified Ensifer]|uniref:glycerophosphodiester phosphodiesterase family protein n=1 Tax=unclassified Ensifer TaxID=2633371 RepID=UPI000812C68F|nr:MULTISPECIES: glycerophosphodiester phosphodiesterase family protein [unclassified Ensifer]OCP19913.1 glycerophosphodiester phosphodiesterase [Ensifer sp. LC54]OCP21097.1 glycerophosphodiester phosphodiesterase [Ensifer sp. LC384]